MAKNAAEKAEEWNERRARAFPALGVFFLIQQLSFFTGAGAGDRSVDRVQIGAWLVMSVVMVLALATGGGWVYSKEVRALANDEATLANRNSAYQLGFIVSMAACIVLYVVSLFEPVGGREALHLVMAFGIATAVLRFGLLERRALKGA